MLRPPSGRYDPNVLKVAGELGYRDFVLWNVDPEDYATPTNPQATFQRARAAIETHDIRREGLIVLLHDVHEMTSKTVTRMIIRYAKEKGWRFVTMDACMGEWGLGYKEPPINNYYSYE